MNSDSQHISSDSELLIFQKVAKKSKIIQLIKSSFEELKHSANPNTACKGIPFHLPGSKIFFKGVYGLNLAPTIPTEIKQVNSKTEKSINNEILSAKILSSQFSIGS